MISYKSSYYLQKYISKQRKLGKTIGFVPTMGALHEGHISLIAAAKKECDIVVCSIFVNPTQFNNNEDLVKYPRTLTADSKMLQEADCDVLFIPSVNTIYPKTAAKFKAPEVGNILNVLEGEHRPGHFAGVMQVVSLLLDKVNPTHLFMGLKDFQQFAICSKMVALQQREVIMRGMPIIREENGLAMSSRNKRLSAKAKEKARIIFQSLKQTKELLSKHTVAELKEMAIRNIGTEKNAELEYFEIVDQETLEPSSKKTNLIALTAVWFEGVRLIDNMQL